MKTILFLLTFGAVMNAHAGPQSAANEGKTTRPASIFKQRGARIVRANEQGVGRTTRHLGETKILPDGGVNQADLSLNGAACRASDANSAHESVKFAALRHASIVNCTKCLDRQASADVLSIGQAMYDEFRKYSRGKRSVLEITDPQLVARIRQAGVYAFAKSQNLTAEEAEPLFDGYNYSHCDALTKHVSTLNISRLEKAAMAEHHQDNPPRRSGKRRDLTQLESN